CGVDDDDGFAFFRSAYAFDRGGGGARKLIDIIARSGSDGFGRNGRDDLRVFNGLYTCDGVDHGDSRLATAGDHIHVHFALPDVLDQVDRRDTEGADGGGGKIDGNDAAFAQDGCLCAVDVGACGVEDELDVVFFEVRQQSVEAFGAGFKAEFFGTREAFGFGIDPDHPDGLDGFTTEHFVEEIGPDISRANDGGVDFG